MPTKKKKRSTKSTNSRKKRRVSGDASGGHDRKSAKKFRRGGRVEAYTFGEALGKRDWP